MAQTREGGLWQKAQQFLLEIPVEVLTGRSGAHRIRKACAFVWMVVRGFAANRGPMRAAALAYTTLLALVPLLVVALSVSKNLLKETTGQVVPRLIDQAVATVIPQLEHLPLPDDAYGPPAPGQAVMSSQARQEVVAKIESFIDEIDAGKLGAVGSFLLVVVALRLMMTIEGTFNDIWGVERGRSIWRKIVYYWATITLGPLLLIAAMTLTGRLAYLRAYGETVVGGWLLQLAPFAMLWVAFSFMYGLMPNTRVRPVAAVAGGIVGGTLWQLNSLLSTLYISRVVTYSKIYGSLGIIPVFLLGLYFSWLIILFGAQVSFATQNLHIYLQSRFLEKVDQRQRELCACRLVLLACQHFLAGSKPPTIEEASRAINVPSQLVNQLVHRLARGGMLQEVADVLSGLQPARPPETMTLADVLRVMRTSGDPEPTGSTEPVEQLLAELHAAERGAPANVNFRDLAVRCCDSSASASNPQTGG